jgi:hypothetical protein
MSDAYGINEDPVQVMQNGLMGGVDDSLWSTGDILWGDPATGLVVNVRPAAPAPQVRIGRSLGSGRVAVKIGVIPAITELSGVLVEVSEDLDIPIFDAALGYHVFRPLFHSKDVSAAYAALPTDNLIRCDATAAPFSVTLPAAASSAAMQIHIKKVDTTTNRVTIDADGTELIDDVETFDLRAVGESIMLQCDGTGWSII